MKAIIENVLRPEHGTRRITLSVLLTLALLGRTSWAAVGDFNGDGRGDLVVGIPGLDVGTATDCGGIHVIYGSSSGLASSGDQAIDQNSSGIDGAPEDDDGFGEAIAVGNFNGDAYDDLAIGIPGEMLGGKSEAGAVVIVYGSSSGLNTYSSAFFSQDTVGIEGTTEAGDNFGATLAAGNFNGDAYDDLAIGVPGEKVGSASGAGAVAVLKGSASGLTSTGDQLWTQDSSGISGGAEDGDRFGHALAAGDFDGDGYEDLAVGVPDENIGSVGCGAVNIIYGSSSGLVSTDNEMFHRDIAGVEGAASGGDDFGSALAAGDFNGDGRDDLAIGVPFDEVGGAENAGSVTVLYGSSLGLSATADQLWSQDSSGLSGGAEDHDWFGYALVAADFDGDGRDDLAIGTPREDLTGGTDAGAVSVLYGTASGLSSTREQFWDQDSSGIGGGVEPYDNFGMALGAGDFDGNGRADLVVGVPSEQVNGISNAGAVNVIYGSSTGLTSTGSQMWHRDDSGIDGSPDYDDEFGGSLAAAR